MLAEKAVYISLLIKFVSATKCIIAKASQTENETVTHYGFFVVDN